MNKYSKYTNYSGKCGKKAETVINLFIGCRLIGCSINITKALLLDLKEYHSIIPTSGDLHPRRILPPALRELQWKSLEAAGHAYKTCMVFDRRKVPDPRGARRLQLAGHNMMIRDEADVKGTEVSNVQ